MRRATEQDLEPGDEALAVEDLALAGTGVDEQVFVEGGDQLLGGGECHELAGIGDADLVHEGGEPLAREQRVEVWQPASATRYLSS